MNEEEKEQLVKKLVEDAYNAIEIPDPSDSWERMRVRLEERRRKRKWVKRVKVVTGVVAMAVVIEAAMITDLPKTYAHVSTLFREVKEQFIGYFFNRPDEKSDEEAMTAPPPADIATDASVVPEETTLEDAIHKLSFPILQPDFLPGTFALDVVRIFREPDGQYRNVYIEYSNQAGDIFKISERVIDPNSTEVKSDIAFGAGIIKETTVKGAQAVLVILPEEQFSYLEWLNDNHVKMTVSGRLTENEIMDIAKSLH